MIKKRINWCCAGSHWANYLGYGPTGCYTVERFEAPNALEILSGHSDINAAIAAAQELPEPWAERTYGAPAVVQCGQCQHLAPVESFRFDGYGKPHAGGSMRCPKCLRVWRMMHARLSPTVARPVTFTVKPTTLSNED